MEGPTALAVGLVGLSCFALVVGAQKRRSWARWTIVALLTLNACASALFEPSPDGNVDYPAQMHIAPNERSGATVGRATSIILMLILSGRLGFGEPARRYFATSPRATA